MVKEKEEMKNNVFAYFLLFFPTLIISAIPASINGGIMLPIMLKLLIAFYQFVSIKNFVDKYYGE